MKLKVVLFVLVALVAVLIFAAGSTNVVRAEEHTVPAGHDLLHTDPNTTFQKIFLLPGFFGPGCDAVSDTVFLEGVPFSSFGIFNGLLPTDTIVERKEDADFTDPDSTQTIQIEIVALSLTSTAPFTVTGCTGGDQLWNLDAEIDSGNPAQNTGTMTLTHQYEDGGRFSTELPVDPNLTFRQVGPPQTVIGPIVSSVLAGGPTEFVAEGPWCHTGGTLDEPPGAVLVEVQGLTSNFFPGIICPTNPGSSGPNHDQQGKRIKCLTKEQAKLAEHGVLPSENPPPSHYDDPILPCPGIVGGITEIVVNDSTPRSEGSGLGASSTVPIAAAVAVIALALATGGWFVRRRLITRA